MSQKNLKRKRVSLSRAELKKVIVEKLPSLLKKEPELKEYLAVFFKDHFADKRETQDEIKNLLEELKALRLESEKKWEESRRRWEELREELKVLRLESEKKWEESRRRWEELREELKALRLESEKKWEEHSRAIRFLFEEVKDLRKRYDIGIGALGARWGIKSEDSFRRALKGLLEENFPVKVERYVTKDLDGEVFEGYPGQLIELDLIIRDGELIVAELKSSISVADVWLFERKVRFFEKKEGKRVTKRVIISPMIDPRAEALIIELGITAYTYVPEPEEGL